MDKNLSPINPNYPLQIAAGVLARPGRRHHLPLLEEAVLEQPLSLETVSQPGRGETGIAGRSYAQDRVVIARPRKSGFIRPFDGTAGLVCNKFYQLILSNGCPFNCQYCYLRLILGNNKGPMVFTNPWSEVERQLGKIPTGVFSTGELADSLAITPPLLRPALKTSAGKRINSLSHHQKQKYQVAFGDKTHPAGMDFFW